MTVLAVIGLPSFNGEAHIERTLRSLLDQTEAQLRIVVVDDASRDRTVDIALSIARGDPRLVVERNHTRVGMIANWRRAFDRATSLFPSAPYFAWGSDHDLWDARWLERLSAALEEHPDAVLAYPIVQRVSPEGERVQEPWRFETVGMENRDERLHAAFRGTVAGDMVYGLYRPSALRAAGVFPTALMPDRLLLARLAGLGEFVQVDEVLWHRRMTAPSLPAQQRRTLFADGAPVRTRWPWWLAHAVALRRPLGTRAAMDYLFCSWLIALRTRAVRVKRACATR